MSVVIDVDAHFDVPIAADEHPFLRYRERLPGREQFIADNLVGDLLSQVPVGSRPDPATFVPFLPDSNASSAEQATRPGEYAPRFPILTPEDRLAWADEVGIDHVFFNPGGYAFLLQYLEGEPDAITACNDFMADRLEGFTDRLIPVALIDWNDLDRAIAELQRMRARGSRAFWIKSTPFAGMSPGHPDLDPLWKTATDLGMVAILHVGNAPMRFDGGWANAGWESPDSPGAYSLFRYANAFRNHSAEMMLGSMLYAGAFTRNPTLTVIAEELGVAWLPHFVQRIQSLDPAGPWPGELSPSETLLNNVRSSPLLGLGDPNVLDGLIDELPGLFVFSSDYSHGEGNPDPVALYEPQLSAIDPAVRDQFLGENIASCFARMGDALKA